MTDTMIERIARILCQQNGEDPDEMHLPPLRHGFTAEPRTDADMQPLWQRYTRRAVDVVNAMREPTDFMLEAGLRECTLVQSVPSVVWEDMIDAALVEGK